MPPRLGTDRSTFVLALFAVARAILQFSMISSHLAMTMALAPLDPTTPVYCVDRYPRQLVRLRGCQQHQTLKVKLKEFLAYCQSTSDSFIASYQKSRDQPFIAAISQQQQQHSAIRALIGQQQPDLDSSTFREVRVLGPSGGKIRLHAQRPGPSGAQNDAAASSCYTTAVVQLRGVMQVAIYSQVCATIATMGPARIMESTSHMHLHRMAHFSCWLFA